MTGGCASKTARLTRAPYPRPPAESFDELLREQRVAARARQLIASGTYKTSNDACNAAECEYPAAYDPGAANWSVEYAQWEKQQAEQEKFEADLAKSIRRPRP
jgi:hypothetical protein